MNTFSGPIYEVAEPGYDLDGNLLSKKEETMFNLVETMSSFSKIDSPHSYLFTNSQTNLSVPSGAIPDGCGKV